MNRHCEQETCPMWDGEGCPCARFGLDPDEPPTDGTWTIGVDSLGRFFRKESAR